MCIFTFRWSDNYNAGVIAIVHTDEAAAEAIARSQCPSVFVPCEGIYPVEVGQSFTVVTDWNAS